MSSNLDDINEILRLINDSDNRVLEIIKFTKEQIKEFFKYVIFYQEKKEENYRKLADEISGDIIIQLLRAVNILENRKDQNAIKTKDSIIKITGIIMNVRKSIGLNPQK
jgi:hypothetical protein